VEGIPGHWQRVWDRTAEGPARIGPVAGADFYTGYQGRVRTRREHFLGTHGATSRPSIKQGTAGNQLASLQDSRRLCPAARNHHCRHKIRIRAHSRGLVLADEVLTPDSSRFWPAE